MKPLSIWMLIAISVGSAGLGSLLSAVLVGTGRNPFMVTPWLAVLFFLVGLWILAAGMGVRRFKRRERTWINAVSAGRTAIFARSSAPIMSVFAGFLLGTSLVGLSRSWAPAMAQTGWMALAAGAAAMFAAITALIVERWCIDDVSDDDEDTRGGINSGGHKPKPHHTRTVSSASHRKYGVKDR